jgi:LysM repeat protein
MMLRLSLPLAFSIALCLFPQHRAAAGDIAQEYDQVRKIALRDPRVREAFDRANERLDEKIVEIDPALKGYVASHGQTQPASASASTPSHAAAPTPGSRPKPKPFVTQKAAGSSGTTHVVAAGDTLASLASRYHVSVASLEAANHISDPHKLQIGQTLVIPGKSAGASAPAAASAPAPARTAPADPQPESMWDKLKSNF